MNKLTYQISIGQPLPSFQLDFHEFDGIFEEAVTEAQRIWRETGLPTGVHSRGCQSYFWYEIGRSGRTINRNIPGHLVGQLDTRENVSFI